MSRDPSKKQIGVEKPPVEPPARSGVIGAMIVAVIVGATLGGVVAVVFLPEYIAAAAIGGALSLGAARVAVFLSSDRRGLAPVDDVEGKFQ